MRLRLPAGAPRGVAEKDGQRQDPLFWALACRKRVGSRDGVNEFAEDRRLVLVLDVLRD
jgi:hypothetical protein